MGGHHGLIRRCCVERLGGPSGERLRCLEDLEREVDDLGRWLGTLAGDDARRAETLASARRTLERLEATIRGTPLPFDSE